MSPPRPFPPRGLLLLVAVLSLGACSATISPPPTPHPNTAVAPTSTAAAPPVTFGTSTAALADRSFSGYRALDTAQWLSEGIGSRPAGSDQESLAAEGLKQRLSAMGYSVALQPFPILAFQDRGSTLSVGGEDVPVRALVYSRSGAVEGPLVEAGLGQTGDLEGKSARGAILLVERGAITFADKARNAAAAGAVGVIVYNTQQGLFSGTVTELSAVPIVALDREAALRLKARLDGAGLAAQLSVDANVANGTSQNVVATLLGSPDKILTIGAHYDGVATGPDANDNGSGTAVAVELARTLAARRVDGSLPYTVKVVLFGAEEIGLVGSRYYVSSLSGEERKRVVAMLNLDMVGVGSTPAVGGSESLIALARRVAAERGEELQVLPDNTIGRDSDHASFIDGGIPALFIHRLDDPRYHTPADRREYLDVSALADAGSLALGVADTSLAR